MVIVLFISLLFGETLALGSDSCNSDGYIRKFVDGSHDWKTAYQRLSLDPENFKCLNYENTLAHLDNEDSSAIGVDQFNYFEDYSNLCKHPHYGEPSQNGGCVQVGIRASNGFSITLPVEQNISNDYGFANIARLDTSPVQSIQTYGGSVASVPVLHSRAPYMPNPYRLNYPANGEPTGPFYYVAGREIPGSSFYLPIYIGGISNITAVKLKYYNEDYELLATDSSKLINSCSDNTQPYTSGLGAMPDNTWCIVNVAAGGVIFHIRANPSREFGLGQNGEPIQWAYAGIVIEYNFLGGDSFVYPSGQTNPYASGITAGNDLYYLTKLGRLELSGIPQIFYEPIYCNSDRSKIVGGIFKNATTRTEFASISFDYKKQTNSRKLARKSLAMIYDKNATGTDRALSSTSSASGPERITFNDKLKTDTIFSADEFACCQKLNSITTSSSRCCSGYSVSVQTQDGNTRLICKLPTRVDLHVYFNKFVSNEGRSQDIIKPARLKDKDFISETGEPKLRQATHDKIRLLGQLYCESGEVIRGGAFGNFIASPLLYISNFSGVIANIENAKYYSIVDEYRDQNVDQFAGEPVFFAGYRWNHHWYCK